MFEEQYSDPFPMEVEVQAVQEEAMSFEIPYLLKFQPFSHQGLINVKSIAHIAYLKQLNWCPTVVEIVEIPDATLEMIDIYGRERFLEEVTRFLLRHTTPPPGIESCVDPFSQEPCYKSGQHYDDSHGIMIHCVFSGEPLQLCLQLYQQSSSGLEIPSKYNFVPVGLQLLLEDHTETFTCESISFDDFI